MLPETKIPNLFSIICKDLLKFLPFPSNLWRRLSNAAQKTNRAHICLTFMMAVRSYIIGLTVVLSAIDNLILTFDLVVIHS